MVVGMFAMNAALGVLLTATGDAVCQTIELHYRRREATTTTTDDGGSGATAHTTSTTAAAEEEHARQQTEHHGYDWRRTLIFSSVAGFCTSFPSTAWFVYALPRLASDQHPLWRVVLTRCCVGLPLTLICVAGVALLHGGDLETARSQAAAKGTRVWLYGWFFWLPADFAVFSLLEPASYYPALKTVDFFWEVFCSYVVHSREHGGAIGRVGEVACPGMPPGKRGDENGNGNGNEQATEGGDRGLAPVPIPAM